MARILNTDDLALAQNAFRNAVRAYIAETPVSEAGPSTASDVGVALLGLADVLGCDSIDATADACEAVGYSRELGAVIFHATAANAIEIDGLGTAHLRAKAWAGVRNGLTYTPEFTRLRDHFCNPVPACCDWDRAHD